MNTDNNREIEVLILPCITALLGLILLAFVAAYLLTVTYFNYTHTFESPENDRCQARENTTLERRCYTGSTFAPGTKCQTCEIQSHEYKSIKVRIDCYYFGHPSALCVFETSKFTTGRGKHSICKVGSNALVLDGANDDLDQCISSCSWFVGDSASAEDCISRSDIK